MKGRPYLTLSVCHILTPDQSGGCREERELSIKFTGKSSYCSNNAKKGCSSLQGNKFLPDFKLTCSLEFHFQPRNRFNISNTVKLSPCLRCFLEEFPPLLHSMTVKRQTGNVLEKEYIQTLY